MRSRAISACARSASGRTTRVSPDCCSTTSRISWSARSIRVSGPTASTPPRPMKLSSTTSKSPRNSASTWPASTSRSSRRAGITGATSSACSSGRTCPPATEASAARIPTSSARPQSAKQYELELKHMIDCLRNHPSIVMWVVFNEGWGQFDTVRITEWTKKYDPSRLVNCASGWTDRGVGDVHDIHVYPGPGSPQAGVEARGGAWRVRRPGSEGRWPHLGAENVGLSRRQQQGGSHAQVRETAGGRVQAQGQAGPECRRLHANHRRGDGGQRPADLRSRRHQGRSGARRRRQQGRSLACAAVGRSSCRPRRTRG